MRYKLGDIFDLQMGKTPDRHNPVFWTEGSEPWISIADLSKCDKYIERTSECISKEAVEKSGIKVIPQETVIMSFKLSIGKVAITQREMYSNEAIMAFINKGSLRIEPTYLYYLLLAHEWVNETNKAVMGKTLNKATLSKIKVHIHSLAEQQEIICTLDKVSNIISARKQQLIELDNLVKARFVEMFESYSSDTVKVGSVFQAIRNGVSPSTRGTCAVKVLTLSAITQGAFDESAWKRGMFDEPPADDKRISKTDLYICRGNGNKELVGTAAYSKHNFPDVVFPDTIIAARVDTSKICLPYLFYAWKHPAVRMQIESGARTTNGTFKINQKTLSEIEIMLPPLDVQIQFAAFVNQVDKSKVTDQI